ncbi:DNA repair protein RecN [Chitinasiproducens palmae]|uniref:DNA repair protein RecN n=1 Tax=Chitinasiproducens palmae TaxID=1770053 RepID=A0A1H2PSD6_9BURK|nr:DNA repair protein RecN [Chitinasiproducens palmae]SDV49466.1 DNA replication and repair protein RecN [Chitinasiproducens palmae]
MLHLLSIRDFVIVDSLAIEFGPNFTVFSGETGAGKSILIDALALVLGARADGGVVREGAQRADISAEFDVDERVAVWLDQQALRQAPDGDADTLLLRRVIDAGGRSRAFVNGTPVTLTQLREVGEFLVDIHGQHAHQLLMRGDMQRQLFDEHAGLAALAAEVGEAWQGWRQARRAIDAARTREREIQLEREQLAWQLGELDALAPAAGEWEELSQEHRRLSHAASLLEGAQAAFETLSEADDAVLGRVAGLVGRLRDLATIDERLAEAVAALEPAEIHLQEAAYSLSHYVQRIEMDPERLQQVETRFAAWHAQSRRLGIAPEVLPEAVAEKRARLGELDAAIDLAALQAASLRAEQAFRASAARLSLARRDNASRLGDAVTAAMQELSMAGGRFEVALLPQEEGGPHGLEQVEFRVAAHPGVAPRPITKVASGGELARISLALAVITSSASPTPTLIFDEVDTGIGGAVAEVVGRLLRQLGTQRQVLCVTHLPQVAAQGTRHLRVAKASEDGASTISRVTPLDAAGRVDEIARMLGGIEITATTRRHAKEMLATR